MVGKPLIKLKNIILKDAASIKKARFGGLF